MLLNIFLKTVRDYRRQILIWGGGLGLIMLSYGAAYSSVFGEGPNRAKLIEDYRKTIDSFSILTGKVYDIDTFGGYINVKIGSVMPVLLGIWALLVGSALVRSEEERGSLDLLASTPRTRVSLLWQKEAGLLVALVGILIPIWLGLTLAAIISKATLSPFDAALACLNWGLAALVFGALALLFSQLTSRKIAASWAGGLMAGTYLLNNLSQSVESLKWTGYINPFYYISLSQPLAISVGPNWGGMVVLALIIVLEVGVAVWMFQQRDLNGYFELFKRSSAVVVTKARKLPEPTAPWLSNNFGFGLRATWTGIVVWALSISAYTLLMLASFNDIKGSMVDLLGNTDIYKQLGFTNLTSNENLLSLFIFLFLVLLVAAYAVIQVASWTSEENEGRLELVLSVPQPRWRLLLTYFGVAVVSTALMIGLTGAIFALSCLIFNISVNAANAFGAFFGLWVVGLIIEAIGYILAAFGPGWAVAVTGGLVIVSYLTDLLDQVLKIPEALVKLSVFREYGKPLVNGLDWLVILVMLTLSVVFVSGAVFRFQQRDIEK